MIEKSTRSGGEPFVKRSEQHALSLLLGRERESTRSMQSYDCLPRAANSTKSCRSIEGPVNELALVGMEEELPLLKRATLEDMRESIWVGERHKFFR